MKFPFRKRQRGVAFTLVELLVVLGIIAILAGIIGVSVGSAIKYAKRTKSSSMATSIQTSVQNYYTEYGVYPPVVGAATGNDSGIDGTQTYSVWTDMIYALCGNVNPYDGSKQTPAVPNTRAIAFLSPSRSDCDSHGVPQNPLYTANVSQQYYSMAIDTGYSGVVGDNSYSGPAIPNFPTSGTNWPTQGQNVVGGVIVWCSNDQPPTTGPTSNPTFWSHTY